MEHVAINLFGKINTNFWKQYVFIFYFYAFCICRL